jgi:hypothetical protein
MEKCVKKVGVYAPNQPSQTPPIAKIERQEAREAVSQGLASWIDSSRSIRLKRLSERMSDCSSRMGRHVIEACWAEKPWALAIADMWPHHKHGECA